MTENSLKLCDIIDKQNCFKIYENHNYALKIELNVTIFFVLCLAFIW